MGCHQIYRVEPQSHCELRLVNHYPVECEGHFLYLSQTQGNDRIQP
jgi:hypothetical protein